MLLDCVCRVNDGAVHVEQQAVKGDGLGRRREDGNCRFCAAHLESLLFLSMCVEVVLADTRVSQLKDGRLVWS
jgi:hypothetical protein